MEDGTENAKKKKDFLNKFNFKRKQISKCFINEFTQTNLF